MADVCQYNSGTSSAPSENDAPEPELTAAERIKRIYALAATIQGLAPESVTIGHACARIRVLANGLLAEVRAGQ
jgi:hypothetical protein